MPLRFGYKPQLLFSRKAFSGNLSGKDIVGLRKRATGKNFRYMLASSYRS